MLELEWDLIAVHSFFVHFTQKNKNSVLLSYDELLKKLAIGCDGLSGAAIAGVVRAGASRALERAVGQLSEEIGHSSDQDSIDYPSIMDCLVTQEDLCGAIDDVKRSIT